MEYIMGNEWLFLVGRRKQLWDMYECIYSDNDAVKSENNRVNELLGFLVIDKIRLTSIAEFINNQNIGK